MKMKASSSIRAACTSRGLAATSVEPPTGPEGAPVEEVEKGESEKSEDRTGGAEAPVVAEGGHSA